jgi:cytochrome P450 family 307 subfamily A
MELTTTTHLLLASFGLLLVALALDAWYKRKQQNNNNNNNKEQLDAPGPYAWPFIGSLHLLGGYEVPYAAFSALAKRYGDVVKLSLGNQKCLIVNGLTNIKEALITKGAHFDGRPNFARFHQLFCGDKENCKYLI